MTMDFTENARLLQIYSGQYCTVIDDDKLFLIEGTKIQKTNAIAILDVKENCTIINRDKINVFIDFSNEHFGNNDAIDRLPESKIIEYVVEFLLTDINELITFNCKNFDYIDNLLSNFNDKDKKDFYAALDNVKLFKNFAVPYTRVYSLSQINYLLEKGYYYICINTQRNRYAVSSTNYKKYYSNGACGPWKKLQKSLDFYYVIFFKVSDEAQVDTKDIYKILEKDLSTNNTIYKTANALLQLEERLTKSLNEVINIASNKLGIVKIDTAYYPKIDDIVEQIVQQMHAYHKCSLENKSKHFEALKELYTNVYKELQKSQDSLKNIYAIIK